MRHRRRSPHERRPSWLTAVSQELASQPRALAPRKRKPSIRRMVAAAEKAGKTVTSITMPDGTVLHFGEAQPPRRAIRGSTISR